MQQLEKTTETRSRDLDGLNVDALPTTGWSVDSQFVTGFPTSADVSPWVSPVYWHLAILGAVCFAVFLWNLGSVGLLDGRESFYGEGAREMMAQKQFLVPLLNYQTYSDSPIFTYWLQILSYSAFGVSEFASRLPSALFACALTFGTYFIGARFRNNNVGLMAALIVCTSPIVVAFGRLGTPDIVFSTLLTGSIYALMARLKGASRRSLVISYVCLGLAALAQGPIAAVVFGAAVLFVSIASSNSIREFRGQISRMEILKGTLGALAISAPWFVAAHVLTSGEWTTEYLSKAGKFFLTIDSGTAWTNFAIASGALLPWVIFVPAALSTALYESASMSNAKSIGSVKSISSSVDQSRRYLLGWLASVLLTCTVLVVNSPAYALPVLPVMALLVAYQIDDWINVGKKDLFVSRYYKSASLVFAVAGIVLLVASALFAIEFLPEYFGLAESDWFSARCSSWMRVSLVAGPFLIAMMLGWQFFKVMTGKLQDSINTLFASAVMMTVLASPIAFKFAYEFFDADLHRATKVLIGKRDGQVAMFRESMPSLSYYLGRSVSSFVDPNLLEQDDSVFGKTSEKNPDSLTKPLSTVYVIGRVSKIVPLVRTHSLRVLCKRGEWLVVEAEKASLKGL